MTDVAPNTDSERYFVNDRHALYVGWVLGLAMRNGVPLALVDDEDGNHTDRLRLIFSPEVTVTFIVPPPPPDWEFNADAT